MNIRIPFAFSPLIFLVALWSSSGSAIGQTADKTSIWVLNFEQDSLPSFDAFCKQYRETVVKTVIRNGRLAVVEREAIQALSQELELQKSEAFIDGKTVDQGKAIGAEYIMSGFLEIRSGILTLKIVDVGTNRVVESQEINLRANLLYGDNNMATSASSKKIIPAVQSMLNRWLGKGKFSVVRVLETKKEKAQTILVGAGSDKGMAKDQEIEIFRIESEQVEEETYERFMNVGWAKISVVENGNFSVAKVTGGGEEIQRLISQGTKLYGRLHLKK